MEMTTKQVADFFGKSTDTVLRAAKKAGVETRKGQAKLYTKEEVLSLSKSLYKTVPDIVKDSIDLTFANAVRKPMANAEAGRLDRLDRLEQLMEKLLLVTGNLLQVQQNNQTQEKRVMLPAPQLDARAHIKKMIDEYVSRNGIEHSDAYRYLYREFFYRTKCNASLCAKNRGMKTIDYIDDEGMIETLEAIAMEVL
jgi:histone H3/H4